MKFGFIGFGNMASAAAGFAMKNGFLNPQDSIVYDINPAATRFAQSLGMAKAESASAVVSSAEYVQLGVKPQNLDELIPQINQSYHPTAPVLVSICAGVSIEKYEQMIPDARVLRLMPNLNAAVGQSITAICANARVGAGEFQTIEAYCNCFGTSLHLPESQFSAFCALASSAPAFVFLFIDELARAGVACGLTKSIAQQIAVQMLMGSAANLRQSDSHPYALIDKVCSPGGTTIAGIDKLREHGFAHAVSQAVKAAYTRDAAFSPTKY
ncbi:MAG: pyrroline-5-carboxylate reductase [Oscillospiraceae bacterium]|jgi:pyrroline-5-carboxylate reductase|nr:pyrroline-5-carboxylate reductase [Oscillospiraceae bacterium]